MIRKMAGANKVFLILCLLLVSSVAIAKRSFFDDKPVQDILATGLNKNKSSAAVHKDVKAGVPQYVALLKALNKTKSSVGDKDVKVKGKVSSNTTKKEKKSVVGDKDVKNKIIIDAIKALNKTKSSVGDKGVKVKGKVSNDTTKKEKKSVVGDKKIRNKIIIDAVKALQNKTKSSSGDKGVKVKGKVSNDTTNKGKKTVVGDKEVKNKVIIDAIKTLNKSKSPPGGHKDVKVKGKVSNDAIKKDVRHRLTEDEDKQYEEDEGIKDQDDDEIHKEDLYLPSPLLSIDEVKNLGIWEVHNGNSGVSAMQLQLMPNNKAVWFDTTTLGPSFRKLDPPGYCPASFEMGGVDCFAHAVSYDIETGDVRTLKIDGDPWCSSGGLDINGDLIGTGGNQKALKSIRKLKKCANCEFEENHNVLRGERWYSTQQILGDGSIIVVGGRNAFSYDLIPGPELNMEPKAFDLPFLKQTTEPPPPNTKGPAIENNLYPFVYLINDENVFIFANNRAILMNPYQGQVVREYPFLPGGSRNYPPSGMSALLPMKLDLVNHLFIDPEVVVCGGNSPNAFSVVDAKHTHEKVYMPALQDCWRMKVLDPKAKWVREQDMPSRRTMGDLLHLPTGDLLFISGAQNGTSGWEDAVEPNLTPVLYSPYKPFGQRFKELMPTTIARMYHASSALLPDGKILVTGSNPHQHYTADGPFPTDTRFEKFAPPYLDEALDGDRPSILVDSCKTEVSYGDEFDIYFKIGGGSGSSDMMVTMIAPPFTTHGFSMNQRMLILPIQMVSAKKLTVLAPAVGGIAPPGYYMVFLVHRGVPSRGMWVKLQ